MKKTIWSKILKVLIAMATAIIGVLGGTNVHDS
ncbi:smalltalk protein [Bacteroides sp.]|nr:smalltalk protein [Bacteroides sp.]